MKETFTAGRMVVFTAPSGGGKTTLVKNILQKSPRDFILSISATTRPKGEGEQDGTDYHFISKEAFQEKIEKDEFFEWQEVYKGAFYGTLRSYIDDCLQYKNLVFDVDVQGALNLKKEFGDAVCLIFVAPPGITILEERLRKRGRDSEEKIRERLEKAKKELGYVDMFEHIGHVIVNLDLEKAKKESEEIVKNFLAKKGH